MERNISSLLTAIDNAAKKGELPDLSGISMEPAARDRLYKAWDILPYECECGNEVVKDCVEDHQGYQVRGIPVLVKPKNNTYSQSVHRELTISLNRAGQITGVRLSLEDQESVDKIMGSGTDVEDLTRREEILKWVEDFRSYYLEKDWKSLNMIYSDNALIITGSVIMEHDGSDMSNAMKASVKYRVRTKEEYMSNLKKLFGNTSYINVEFDHIDVVKHARYKDFYGVTLRQKWNHKKTSGAQYSDDGWLFLLWDFREPGQPKIHVRTWQADEAAKMDGVFNMDDFPFNVIDN